MSRRASFAAMLAGPLVLGACAVPPPAGTNVWVLPGQGKDLAHFEQDQAACRDYALQQAGFGPSRQAPASRSPAEAQQRYDLAYLQCMAARGNRVPGIAADDPYLLTPYSRPGGYPPWYGTPYYGYSHGYPGPYFGTGISLSRSGQRL